MKHQLLSITLLACALALTACSKTSDSAVPAPTANTATPAPEHDGPRIARDPLVNAAPLGVEVGYANIDGVRSKLGDLTSLTDAGTNEYSNGRMLSADGSGLGIDGLKSALFIFDQANTLQGVVLKMPRGPRYPGATADLAKTLGGKYQLVSKGFESFMDYGTFHFEQGDSRVDIDSPHLSFSMTVRYATKESVAAYEASLDQAAKAAKESKEALL